MRGGSLKNSLSRCWFCIRCHFPISILFSLGKAGWYCVTRGRSLLRADLFVTPVLAPFLGPNWLFSFYSVFGIELFKKFEKREKEKTKKNQNCVKSGLSQFLFLQRKDEICWSNGDIIFIFFWLYNVAHFVNVNVIHHV